MPIIRNATLATMSPHAAMQAALTYAYLEGLDDRVNARPTCPFATPLMSAAWLDGWNDGGAR